MTRIELRHVHRFRDRHGRERHYLRVPGQKAIALPGPAGSPEFMSAYNQAIATLPAKPAIGAGRTQPGTLDALAINFYDGAAFKGLRESTQTAYRRIVEEMRAKHGVKPVRAMDAIGVGKLMAEKTGHPTAANHRLRLLRLLMKHAIALGWRSDDPTSGVAKHPYKTDGFRPWEEGHIAQYRARHPSGTDARLSLELLLNTGQRRSDVVRLGRQHVRDGVFSIRQVKTGALVTVPVLPELEAELAQVPTNRMTFLETNGRPRSPNGFYNMFIFWCEQAGIPAGLSPHGLRKSCGRRLAEAGCSAHEIMAILGHETLSEAQKYTKDADRKRLAASGMARITTMPKKKLKGTNEG